MGTEATARKRGSQDGDTEQENVHPKSPGPQESFPERALVGSPEQEKEFGPTGGAAAATAAAVVRAFRGRLYRPHRDGELPVSGRRPCRGGGGERARTLGRRLSACGGGWVDVCLACASDSKFLPGLP